MTRVHRLFQIHDSLSRGDPPRNAQAWARAYCVNVRTILRDMAFLKKQLRVPLFFDPSVRGRGRELYRTY